MIDLGVQVAPETFVEAIREHNPDIVGFSAFLTTTMPMFKTNIAAIEKAGLREGVIIMVGGAPVTQEYADVVGADGYAADGVGQRGGPRSCWRSAARWPRPERNDDRGVRNPARGGTGRRDPVTLPSDAVEAGNGGADHPSRVALRFQPADTAVRVPRHSRRRLPRLRTPASPSTADHDDHALPQPGLLDRRRCSS